MDRYVIKQIQKNVNGGIQMLGIRGVPAKSFNFAVSEKFHNKMLGENTMGTATDGKTLTSSRGFIGE